MARMKIIPWEGEKGKARKGKTWLEVYAVPAGPPTLAEPPVPTEEAPPTMGKVGRRRVEVSKWRR